ncbi:MAG: double zinc ribbon domain-containing protein [Chloroflexota bacterium]
MSEIICRSCGARNPTKSKFCNKCGAELRSGTSQICPNCERSNPIELLYCDHCGTLLADDALLDPPEEEADEEDAPESRSKPFSLPSRPPGQTGNLDVSGDIPEWLRTGDADEEAGGDDEETPDWLQAAQASDEWEDSEAPTLEDLSGSHAPSDDLPTWLLEDEAGDAIFNSEKDTNELFRQGSGSEQADMADDAPQPEAQLPEWLEGLSPPDSGPLPFISDEDESPDDVQESTEENQTGDPASELQSWLNAMEQDESASAGSEPPAEASSQEQQNAEDVEPDADWLQEFDSGADEQAQTQMELETPADADDDFARWLTGEEISEGAATGEGEEPPVQSLDDEDFQQWLADARLEESASKSGDDEMWDEEAAPAEEPDADTPVWMQMSDDEFLTESGGSSPTDPDSEAAPDWLAEFEEESLGEIQQPFAEDDDDDWLEPLESPSAEDVQQADEEAGEEMTEEDFLAWLATLDEGGLDAEESAEDASPAAEAGAPDELSLPEDEASEAQEVLPSEEDLVPEEPRAQEAPAELPSWLGELGESDQTVAEADDDFAGDLPDWLQSTLSESEAGPLPYVEAEGEATDEIEDEAEDSLAEPAIEEDIEAAESAAEAGEEVPEWLAGVSDEFDSESAPSFAGDAPEVQDETQPSGEEPLEALQPAEDEIQEDLDFADASLDPDASDDLVPTEDLPDWFSDVMADIETESELGDQVEVPAELSNVPPQLAADDLPEWLDSPFVDSPDAEPTPLNEIPEWLKPPPRAGREDTVGEEELLSLGAPESSDEWADLLDALPPPERDSESLSQADIPEWLQALKPQALREDSEEAPAPQEPEESEGPLAGLRGVIGVAPAMAHPRAAERIDPDLSAQEHEQQVALLRQLARSEGSAISPRALPSATTTSSTAVRVLLAVLLLVALLIGLFFTETIVELAPWAPVSTAADAAGIIDAAAGEPVIVAFEYTPALAGALNADAHAVLAKLADNNSSAILVSQTAAGATLAQQAASDTPDLQSVDVGYVPGGAAGLRSMAQCIANGQPCPSLFGRPLAQDDSAALNDAALIVVLSGERTRLIDWVEQVQTTSGVAMLTFVTEAIAPVAAPYADSRQLTVVSSSGHSTLEADSEPLPPQTAAVTMGRGLAIGIILIGAIYYLVAGQRRTPTNE